MRMAFVLLRIHSMDDEMKVRIWNPFEAFRPKVTPDPIAAAELEKRMRAVRYEPETAFHRDRKQQPLPSLLRKQA
jgi:hypothetical protein